MWFLNRNRIKEGVQFQALSGRGGGGRTTLQKWVPAPIGFLLGVPGHVQAFALGGPGHKSPNMGPRPKRIPIK